MKTSYIKEKYINSVGLEVLVMGIRDMTPEEEAYYINDLKNRTIETFEDGSFVVEEEDTGLCGDCHDHCGIETLFTADFEEKDSLSNCCGAAVHTF